MSYYIQIQIKVNTFTNLQASYSYWAVWCRLWPRHKQTNLTWYLGTTFWINRLNLMCTCGNLNLAAKYYHKKLICWPCHLCFPFLSFFCHVSMFMSKAGLLEHYTLQSIFIFNCYFSNREHISQWKLGCYPSVGMPTLWPFSLWKTDPPPESCPWFPLGSPTLSFRLFPPPPPAQ